MDTGRTNTHGLGLLIAALAVASCDPSTEPELMGEALCVSLTTKEACDDALPDGQPFATCAWVEWNEVQVDPATGASRLSGTARS
jgi:hypothetical protein